MSPTLALAAFLLGPWAGLAAGLWLRQRHVRWRPMVLALMLALIAVVGASAVASAVVPGPERGYAAGSHGWMMRRYLIAPGMLLTSTLPAWVAATVCCWVPAAATLRGTALRAAAAGLLAMLPSAMLLLYIGCHHAGACL